MGDAVNMYASRKIAFCDLTCSDPKYINPGGSTKYPQGKRNYILEQIEDTSKWLMSDLMIYHCLSTATCRQIIIGIRHNNIQVTSSPATAMKAFTQTPSSTANSLTTKQIIKSISFDIVEITYPTPLEWCHSSLIFKHIQHISFQSSMRDMWGRWVSRLKMRPMAGLLKIIEQRTDGVTSRSRRPV